MVSSASPSSSRAARQRSEVLVDVGDHAVEPRPVLVRNGVPVHLHVAGLHVERAVRGVGGDVAEERLLAMLLDEAQPLAEEHVGAVAGEAFRLAVHVVGVVEVVVPPRVAGVSDAAAGVVDRPLEPALVGAERLAVAQVPLAEVAGAVAGVAQRVRQRPLVLPQQRTAADGVPDAGAVAVVAGQQAGAGRRAGGADVKVREAHPVGMVAVDVGGADHVVAVATQVAVALIVSQDEDDVRPFPAHRQERSMVTMRPGASRGSPRTCEVRPSGQTIVKDSMRAPAGRPKWRRGGSPDR